MEIIDIQDSSQNYECPMCFNFVKNLKKTCLKNINGHNICYNCDQNLKEKYGLKKSGCIYCGDRSEKQRNVIEISVNINNVNQIIVSTDNEPILFNSFIRSIIIAIIWVGLCLLFNIVFCFSRFLYHIITSQDHNHKIEISPLNTIFGAIISGNICCTFFGIYTIISKNNSVGIYE